MYDLTPGDCPLAASRYSQQHSVTIWNAGNTGISRASYYKCGKASCVLSCEMSPEFSIQMLCSFFFFTFLFCFCRAVKLKRIICMGLSYMIIWSFVSVTICLSVNEPVWLVEMCLNTWSLCCLLLSFLKNWINLCCFLLQSWSQFTSKSVSSFQQNL